MYTKQFIKNVEKWAQKYPQAAIYLPSIDTNHLTSCKTEKDQSNLKHDNAYFHSTHDATAEAEKWFSKLNLLNNPILFVYGVGLGYAYEAAKSWLKKKRNRRLIFLEDDLGVIRHLFETEIGTHILKDSQVQLHFFTQADLENPSSSLSELYWNFLTSQILVSALPYYESEKKEIFQELKHRILYDATLRESHLEYLDYGILFFKSFYPNLKKLEGSYLGNNLFGKFKDVPAIVCGAGPSLEKHLPLLHSLRDKALIFGGGSSLNVLNAAGIQPHFGAGVDPNLAQFDRLSTNSAFETPFLYRNRLYPPAFDMVHGPRLYVTGSGGYDISEWFEKKLKIKGRFIEEGFNVVNFCLELANAFGCNPIIFVGMDLAYTNMRLYAPGVTDNAEINEEAVLNLTQVADQAVLKTDIYGKPIYTVWKWISESQWVSNFAKEHPKITVINSTEGGLGFSEVPNIPLNEVVNTHLTHSYDLEGWVHTEIQNGAMPQITTRKVIAVMKNLRKSLQRCKEGLDLLLKENNLMKDQVQKEKVQPAFLQSGLAVLCETELLEEPGYKHVLDVFNRVYMLTLTHEAHLVRSSNRTPEWRTTLKKLDLNAKKLIFLRNVALVNMELINRTLNEEK
jgi:hypothetical protein